MSVFADEVLSVFNYFVRFSDVLRGYKNGALNIAIKRANPIPAGVPFLYPQKAEDR